MITLPPIWKCWRHWNLMEAKITDLSFDQTKGTFFWQKSRQLNYTKFACGEVYNCQIFQTKISWWVIQEKENVMDKFQVIGKRGISSKNFLWKLKIYCQINSPQPCSTNHLKVDNNESSKFCTKTLFYSIYYLLYFIN